MGSLRYVGKKAAANADLISRDYLTLVKQADLSIAEIDSAITAGLAGYATIGYVNSKDALNATKAYIDAGDAGRLKLAQKGIANGVCPLDATARVPTARINAVLTQKWVRGPWTPPAYHPAPVSVTAETTLYTCPVTDPGYPYKLVVFGMIDSRPDRESEYPVVNVRVASATGEIVATGYGQADAPDAAVPVNGEKFSTAYPDGLGENWNQEIIEGTGGFYKVENGEASWVEEGNTDREWHYRRLGPDATTLTSYQKLRLTIGSNAGEDPIFGSPHRIRACARMNTAEADWVGFELTHDTFTMQYCTDGTTRVMGGAGWTLNPSASFSTDPATGTSYDILAGTVNSLRQFLYFRNNVLIGGAVDTNGVTKADPAHRGWGWQARAAAKNFFQNDPPSVNELLIADAPPSFGSMSLLPANVAGLTTRTGSTTLFIRGVRSGPAANVTFSTYKPRLTIFAVPA